MGLLIFYSSLTHISLSSSPSAVQYSPPPSPSPLSHSLSSSLFPVALFSSYSWIWATINFLSTITDLYPSLVFFPLLFALFSLFYRRGSGCGSRLWLWFPIVGLVVIFDYDQHQRRSLGCGSGLWISPLCSISRWTDRALSSHQRVGSLNQFLAQEFCEWTSGFVKEARTRITTRITHWFYSVWAILFHRFTVQVSSPSSLWFSWYFSVYFWFFLSS